MLNQSSIIVNKHSIISAL